MASAVDICNLALQKLGAGTITSLTQDSTAARACNGCYEHCKDSELEKHPWRFAISRAELAADGTAPDWGRSNSFALPSDFLRLMNDYPEDNSLSVDYEIEGRKILSDMDAPLYIRYIKRVTDPNEMHTLFREALACAMAIQMCEALTQSNTKKDSLISDYKNAINEAKRKNAIENISAEPPIDPYISVRT